MAQVAELLGRADELMDRAETQIAVDIEKGRLLFREAVANLEQAYLTAKTDQVIEDRLVDAAALFEQCLQQEPDFEVIRTEIELLAGADCADSEIICDAVNEIWDFMYGLMEEMEQNL